MSNRYRKNNLSAKTGGKPYKPYQQKNNHNLAAKTGSGGKSSGNKLYPQLVEKTITQTRQDIAKWKTALNATKNADNPCVWSLYNLYDYILDDAVLTSQIENRIQDTLGSTFNLRKKGGEIDIELTQTFQNSELFNEIIIQILNSRFYGSSLIELDWKQEGLNEPVLKAELLPRQNVISRTGTFLPDYNEDKGVKYRELPEFGTWLLEFGKAGEIGLLNKAVPHALFKRFAQSCWSELCEIYGVPPRVYKTDAQDPAAVARGKKMMQDMGSAAWFIIDTTEEFEWAKGVSTNGDVYSNLLRFCDNQNTLLISGAIIGQDTEHGSYNKDASGQKLLSKLVLADMALVEMYMNTKVMPALARIGIVPADFIFQWEISEDLQTLWDRTIQALQHYEIDPEWVKEKFGIAITGVRQNNLPGNANLNIAESFFV
ncbi:phage portal protein family protein [Chryseobacterium sp. 2R14A]|uniref:phage portal protein family protein n=1 Tax=Chryseobacterium sp. 2R14A TaxID=3380353 RepID=UPI003CFAB0CC